MAGTSLFLNLARGAKVLALLLFFLPWVAVSCSPDAMQRMQAESQAGTPQAAPPMGTARALVIARASGLDMALGQIQMVDPTGGGMPSRNGPGAAAGEAPQPAPEIGVIAGAALLVLALVLTFLLKGTAAALAGAGGSLLAAVAFCYSVFVNYPAAVIAAFVAVRREGNASADQIAQILNVAPEAWFYLVLGLLALAIVCCVLAMRKPVAAASAPAAAPPAEPPATG
jgi:hypothetical protein